MRPSARFALLAATALATLPASAGVARAQESQQTAQQQTAQTPALEEVTVTARRREENLINVPVAVSVVTSATLEKLNLHETTQIADYTPSVNFSDFTPGNNRNDAGAFRSLQFRGLGGGSGVVSRAIFVIDGATQIAAEVTSSLDIGQVEVLRGPQSVAFGRSAMAGAVSYRTKAIPDRWEGEIQASYATYNQRNVEATYAGPVVGDIFGVRITGRVQKNDGYIRNDFDNATKLGATGMNAVSGTFELKPSENFRSKAYVQYFDNNNGPAATGLLNYTNANCQPPDLTSRYYCGEIPTMKDAKWAFYNNIAMPANVGAFLAGGPIAAPAGFKGQVGMQRKSYGMHNVIDWDLSDYLSLQSITALHNQKAIEISDGLVQPTLNGVFGQPGVSRNAANWFSQATLAKDLSQEVRLSSTSRTKYRWTAGFSYLDGDFLTNTRNYNLFNPTATNPNTTQSFLDQGYATSESRTFGFYGGAYIDISAFTVSLEGRYQIDKRRQTLLTAAGVFTEFNKDFKTFLPRAALNYHLDDDVSIYASYAVGSRPGGFNTGLLNFSKGDPAIYQLILNGLGVSNIAYNEEKLKTTEVGLKGEFFEKRVRLNLDGYYGRHVNVQVTNVYIPPLGRTDINGGNSISAINNGGTNTLKGIELDGAWAATEHLNVNFSFFWNSIKQGNFVCTAVGGQCNFNTTTVGKQFAFVPYLGGSLVLSYTDHLTGDWDWFTNASLVYRGKQYALADNLAWISGRERIGLHLGVEKERLQAEVFVENLTNSRAWTNAQEQADFGTGLGNVTQAGIDPARTLGIKLTYKF